MKKQLIGFILFSMVSVCLAQKQTDTITYFSSLNLEYKGLEPVNGWYKQKNYTQAAQALLSYFRNREDIKAEYQNGKSIKLREEDRLKADNALLHKFQPHKGYGFFDYGKDINWQLWPVKDNEVRWQLHRLTWWKSMGITYLQTGNEAYAIEWIAQFRDWYKKNPLGLSPDNDEYAWRALEISERLNNIKTTFAYFIHSPNFTPDFLLEFLTWYHEQADVLPTRYAEMGNHRLFEAQRELSAGAFFPEFKAASAWRKSGVEILTTEIAKQVYPDGLQWELAPGYHNAMISTFLEGLRAAQRAGMAKEFPDSYKQTIEKMVFATINFSFPDYTFPMFGDAWLTDKQSMLKQYKNWGSAFPENKIIQYFATDHQEGTPPPYLSHGSTTGGFYTFRNGWENNATVMVVKASPPGKFHAQPDNGTFELWVNGKNFMPDAGAFVYSGDAEINKLRQEYRQTKVHNTLTLNSKDLVQTDAKLKKWKTGNTMDVLTYTNPSYPALNHQRSILFINKKFFLIIDQAIGRDTGQLAIRFHLKEDANPTYDLKKKRVYTSYTNSSNLLIQNFNTDNTVLKPEQSKVSYSYRHELSRPALAFEKKKTTKASSSFISILYPYETTDVPEIRIKENTGNNIPNGTLDLTIEINGEKVPIKAALL